MTYDTPHDEIRAISKRVAALSLFTTLVYTPVMAWRLSVSSAYSEQLVNAKNVTLDLEDNWFYNFYINYSDFFTYNFVVIMILALLLPMCGIFGASSRDRFLLQFFCCCNGVMTVLSFGMLLNFAMIGNACTQEYNEEYGDCSLLTSTFWVSIIFYALLFMLYMFSTFFSNQLYNNPYLTTANKYNKSGESRSTAMTPIATYASRQQPEPAPTTPPQEIHVHVHTGIDV